MILTSASASASGTAIGEYLHWLGRYFERLTRSDTTVETGDRRQNAALTRTGTRRIHTTAVFYAEYGAADGGEQVTDSSGSLVYLGSFAIAVVSGVVPIVNAELYLLGLVLAIGGIPEALVLAVLIAAGQMIGKGVLYQTARGATRRGARRAPKLAHRLQRARAKLERWRSKPYSVTFVSAAVGLPPLYLVTLAAGALEIRFRAFLLVGFAGRTLRFGTIGMVAALA